MLKTPEEIIKIFTDAVKEIIKKELIRYNLIEEQ
jgi:hypothetical protein